MYRLFARKIQYMMSLVKNLKFAAKGRVGSMNQPTQSEYVQSLDKQLLNERINEATKEQNQHKNTTNKSKTSAIANNK